MKFEVYEGSSGDGRWRLIAGNGQNVANGGEGFASVSGAKAAAENFKGRAADYKYEITQSEKSGEWYWKAVASNGQTTAIGGEGFSSEASAERAAYNVRDNAGSATNPE